MSTFVDLHFVPHVSRASTIAGRVSVSYELQRQTSGLQRNSAFLRRGRLASGELTSVRIVRSVVCPVFRPLWTVFHAG